MVQAHAKKWKTQMAKISNSLDADFNKQGRTHPIDA
jgi:hypothetical protein